MAASAAGSRSVAGMGTGAGAKTMVGSRAMGGQAMGTKSGRGCGAGAADGSKSSRSAGARPRQASMASFLVGKAAVGAAKPDVPSNGKVGGPERACRPSAAGPNVSSKRRRREADDDVLAAAASLESSDSDVEIVRASGGTRRNEVPFSYGGGAPAAAAMTRGDGGAMMASPIRGGMQSLSHGDCGTRGLGGFPWLGGRVGPSAASHARGGGVSTKRMPMIAPAATGRAAGDAAAAALASPVRDTGECK